MYNVLQSDYINDRVRYFEAIFLHVYGYKYGNMYTTLRYTVRSPCTHMHVYTRIHR